MDTNNLGTRISCSLVLILVLILSFSLVSGKTQDETDKVVDIAEVTKSGNKVYMDDSSIYISAEPHTLHASGYVYFTIRTKAYTGNVDIYLAFNSTTVKPSSLELEIYNKTVTFNRSCSGGGFFSVIDEKKSILNCYLNTSKTIQDNKTGEKEYIESSKLLWTQEYDSYYSKTGTVSWSEVLEKSYTDLGSLAKTDKLVSKWDKLHSSSNIPLTAGQTYVVRAWISVPMNSVGEYALAVKPSTLSIDDSISDKKFYVLDPWYNVSFPYCKNFSINTTVASNLANFPAHHFFDSASLIAAGKLKSDCSNIRFLGANLSDYYYELENGTCNTANTLVWLRIPETNGTTNTEHYYCYGNNDTVNGENKPAVWIGYDRVFHLADQSDSTGNSTGLSLTGSPTLNSSILGTGYLQAGSNDDLFGSYTFPDSPFTISFYAYGAATDEEKTMFVSDDGGGRTYNFEKLFIGNHYVYTYFRNAAGTTFSNWNPSGGVTGTNTWFRMGFTSNAATDHRTYVNRASTYNTSTDVGTVGGQTGFVIGGNMAHQSIRAFNGVMDEVRISAVARSEDWMFAEYSQTSIDGVETEYVPPAPPAQLNVTVSLPENGNLTKEAALYPFTYKVIGTNATYNCSLFVDDILSDSSESVANNTDLVLNATSLLIGQHYWNVTCWSNSTFYNSSSPNWNVSIFTLTPCSGGGNVSGDIFSRYDDSMGL
jgi:hypothetical protein